MNATYSEVSGYNQSCSRHYKNILLYISCALSYMTPVLSFNFQNCKMGSPCKSDTLLAYSPSCPRYMHTIEYKMSRSS